VTVTVRGRAASPQHGDGRADHDLAPPRRRHQSAHGGRSESPGYCRATVRAQISDALRGSDLSNGAHFYSLQKALFLPNFVLVLGGLGFLVSAWFVEADKAKCLAQMHGERPGSVAYSRPRRPGRGGARA